MQCKICHVEIHGGRVYQVLSKEVRRERLQELYPDGVADVCADCFPVLSEQPPVQTSRQNDVGQQIVLLYNHAQDWHTDSATRGLAAAERDIEAPYINQAFGRYWAAEGPEAWCTKRPVRRQAVVVEQDHVLEDRLAACQDVLSELNAYTM